MDDTKYSHSQLHASFAALRMVLLAILQNEATVRNDERTGYRSVCVHGLPRIRSIDARQSVLVMVGCLALTPRIIGSNVISDIRDW